MLRRAFIAFAAWQAGLNDRLAMLGKSTRVAKFHANSKAALLARFRRCERLLRRALKAGLLQAAATTRKQDRKLNLPSDSFL